MKVNYPLLSLCLVWAGSVVFSPHPATGAQDPLSLFFQLKNQEGIETATRLLENPDLDLSTRNHALTALASIHLVEGRRSAAEAAFIEILRVTPGYDLPVVETMPPEVVDTFYRLRDRRILSDPSPPEFDIHTLAVGEIENNSILAGPFNLDHLARGLSQIIISDLGQVSSLTLVDRRRLQVIREEIALNRRNIVDPAYRVPPGKLTGVRSFLFGSLIQVEKDKIRLDVRWVDTSTGEILLSEGKELKLRDSKDLLKLEQIVVMELLLPKLEALLDSQESVREDLSKHFREKQHQAAGHSNYFDLVLKTGEAVLAEDRGDYGTAYGHWTLVLEMDPTNTAALSRVRALKVWLGQMESQ